MKRRRTTRQVRRRWRAASLLHAAMRHAAADSTGHHRSKLLGLANAPAAARTPPAPESGDMAPCPPGDWSVNIGFQSPDSYPVLVSLDSYPLLLDPENEYSKSSLEYRVSESSSEAARFLEPRLVDPPYLEEELAVLLALERSDTLCSGKESTLSLLVSEPPTELSASFPLAPPSVPSDTTNAARCTATAHKHAKRAAKFEMFGCSAETRIKPG